MKQNKKYIVVGGGIAGMIAATYIAREGKNVTVLEQSHHTGGNQSGFIRKGYYFDGGDQSFESLGIVFPILKDLGLYDRFTWTKVRYRFMSKDFDFFVDSLDEVTASLVEAFPDEPGIPVLFKEIRRVSDFIDKNCSAHSFPLINDFTISKLMSYARYLPDMRKWLTYEYREKACSVIKNPSLRRWFTGIGYQRMPFLFFAGFWNIWMKDYWYPEGGMQNFHDVIADNYKSLGGKLRCVVTVNKIETSKGAVSGVRTADGEFIEADKIIYAADYKSLAKNLLEPSTFSPGDERKIENSALTESLVATFLGLNISAAELKQRLQAHHVFWFPNYDVVFPESTSPQNVHANMWVTANCFGEENPGFAPEGKSTLVLQTYSSASWQQFWKNGSLNFDRTDEYYRCKEKVSDELISLGENFLPGLSGMIDYRDTGSPLSHHRFSFNSEGSSGGWCYDNGQSLVYKKRFLNMMKTPVKNLIAAGHYTVWPGGVISAALSGRLAANIALDKKILTPLECSKK